MSEGERSGRSAGSLVVAGAIGGILLLSALRFLAQPPAEHGVHYHANWAVFVEGARLDLTDDRYMEDVARCSVDPAQQRPQDRVHMHEGNDDIVHVHAPGVTWGHLLANLGFGVGDDYLEIDAGRYTTTPDRTLKFIINGSPVRSIRNRPVGNEDRLLISYGPESVEEVVATQFPLVATSAPEFNTLPDPASCSGHAEESFGERVRRAVWF
jgi:hypothetical protein